MPLPVKLSYEILDLETRHEFRIARADASAVRQNVWVQLFDDDIEGWGEVGPKHFGDRKSTRLNSSHLGISYAVFCLKKKKTDIATTERNHMWKEGTACKTTNA